MDLIEVLVIGVISFISVLSAILIGLKIGINQLENTTFFDDLLINMLQKVSNDEELQKMLYQVGGILGQGVKGGIGIASPKTGKFKWQDLAVELASQWVTKTISSPSPSPAPSPTPSQDILTKKIADKW